MANPEHLEILRQGGSAVDAAIAVQTVLGLVEPQSSGIGGGAFLVRYDGETKDVTVYDGRETAPSGADETLFLDEDGNPLAYITAWQSGRSAGVPGAIAMLAKAHADHGQLDWAAGFAEAERLADEGFPIPVQMSNAAGSVAQFARLDEHPRSAAYFFDENGNARPAGEILTNPEYAETMRLIAADWRNFYTGEIAEGIVATVGEAPLPGSMSLDDVASYEPIVRDVICQPYRTWQICSAPPPSSGGIAQGAILRLMERFDMSQTDHTSVDGWHRFIEASRLVYADRDRYVGDPAFADVPTEGLIDGDYLASRSALISVDTAIPVIFHGTPPGAPDVANDTTDDQPGTSHFVVVDTNGNVVSMTTTIESAFGNNRMTPGGFLLNNELTDFAFSPRDETGRLQANAVAAGKRPRSSMSPTIVLDENGDFVLATGSPGGNSIVAYTAKTLVAMLDWGLTPQQAAALPNVVARGDITFHEPDLDADIVAGLQAMGHQMEASNRGSGIHIVRRLEDGSLVGGADPRREGIAAQP